MFNRIPGAAARVWRADSSRPETINHVKNKSALQIEPAQKWKGSVEDGIAWLRSFDAIIIHPRCQHTAQEARLYGYKVDRLSGDVLAEVQDRSNHCWDAIRYACEPMIFGATNMGIWSRL
jgi:phage terminase large subunit